MSDDKLGPCPVCGSDNAYERNEWIYCEECGYAADILTWPTLCALRRERDELKAREARLREALHWCVQLIDTVCGVGPDDRDEFDKACAALSPCAPCHAKDEPGDFEDCEARRAQQAEG
ncbi:hypothetical protein [Desulfovibrio sp. X2]|uniref:hypothetical protein n=1 Tax=Desulfovibrio sp. X2 TaxID=941449 RepID=UPI0005576BA0|nr:hypothetical protein [Desulfovibrio sp. X2]